MRKTTRTTTVPLGIFILAFLCSLGLVRAYAAPKMNMTTPQISGGGSAVIISVVNHFKGIVATKSILSEKARRKDLLKSVRAIEDRGLMHTKMDCDKRWKCEKWKNRPKYKRTYTRCLRRFNYCCKRAGFWQKRRERIVTAALKAEKATGVDATLLIALGRMESDFKPLQLIDAHCGKRMIGGGRRACGADCGITQHRLYGKEKYVRRMCKKYAKDYDLVFLTSAKEIASHIKYCKSNVNKKYHHPLRRCVLNRYNQGTFYKTKARCRRYHRCSSMMQKNFPTKEMWFYTYKRCKKALRKCLNIAAYWTKLSCFEYGARTKIKSKRSCRRCFNYRSIHKFYPSLSTPRKAVSPLLVSSR